MSRDHLVPFPKGKSGNPSGLPKAYKEMARLARSHSPEAIERLVELMRDKRNKNVSLRACEVLLDRAWGRAPQAVVGEAGEGPVKISVSWRGADDTEKSTVIDVTPEPLLITDENKEDNA